MNLIAFMLQSDNAPQAGGAFFGVFGIVMLAFIIFMIAAMWKVFEKAGEPGWAAIIPIYNLYILVKIAGRPTWWFLLFFVPIVSIIIAFVVAFDVAKRFGKGAGFAIGMIFLPFVFYPLLAWGDAQYTPAPAMA